MVSAFKNTTILFMATLAFASPAQASDSVEIESWLRRPGVRLLAIEFYATWCGPCMAALPKWKELQKKHRRDGLRVVVVATQDPKACAQKSKLPFQPDDFICDSDGAIAELFNANPLPAAYLWSWQGHLLAKKQEADKVGSAILDWMRSTPRVDVSVSNLAKGAGITKVALSNMVRGRMRQDDKITVIASEQERKKLQSIKAKSFEARYDTSLQCQVGKDLSANSLLEIFITGTGQNQRLQLNMLSAERGCLVGSQTVDWNPSKADVSVAEAVTGLMQKIRSKTQLPWDRSSQKNSSSVGFGRGLKNLGAIPELKTFEAQMPTATNIANLDLAFLKILQTAKRTEKRATASSMDKARAWGAVASYKGKNPLRDEALKRQAQWKQIAKTEKQRAEQLAKVKKQYLQEKKKLRELLALDDDVLPPQQKAAIQAEFKRAYAKWEDALEPERELLLSARPSGCGNASTAFGWQTNTSQNGSKIIEITGEPARSLGLRKGDIIKKAGYTKITKCEHYADAGQRVWDGRSSSIYFEVLKTSGVTVRLKIKKPRNTSSVGNNTPEQELVLNAEPKSGCSDFISTFGWNTKTDSNGAKIIKIQGPPANTLGLQVGDVIKWVDGRPITNCTHYAEAAAQVWRGAKSYTKLELIKKNGGRRILRVVKPKRSPPTTYNGPVTLYLKARPNRCLNASSAFGWSTSTNKNGSKILSANNEPARSLGLRKGDIIKKVDFRKVTKCDDYANAAQKVWDGKRSSVVFEVLKTSGTWQKITVKRNRSGGNNLFNPNKTKELVLKRDPQSDCKKLVEAFGWNTKTSNKGSRVFKITGSPARSLGVKIDDTIKYVDGKKVTKCETYSRAAHDVWVGNRTSTRFEMRRKNGTTYYLRVVAPEYRKRSRSKSIGRGSTLYMKRKPMSSCSNLKEVFGWSTTTNSSGAKINSVSGPSSGLGLKTGDVIKRANGRTIRNCKDYVQEALKVWNGSRSSITLDVKKKSGGWRYITVRR